MFITYLHTYMLDSTEVKKKKKKGILLNYTKIYQTDITQSEINIKDNNLSI